MIVHVKLSIDKSDFDAVNYHCSELFKLSNRNDFGFVRYGLSNYEGRGRHTKIVEKSDGNKPGTLGKLFN